MKDTYVNDYVDEVNEKFPEFTKEDIKKILNFGWRSIYLLNVYGADTLLKDDSINKFLFYIGRLTFNSLRHYDYYKFKMVRKLRILYNRRKPEFDGYYYLPLTKRGLEEFKQQYKPNRKKYVFTRIHLYKMLDEIKYNKIEYELVLKVHIGIDIGFKFFKEKYETRGFEYIQRRTDNGFEPINNSKQYINELFERNIDHV